MKRLKIDKKKKAKTERFINSVVINMKRMSKEEEKENMKTFKKLLSSSGLRTCISIKSLSFRKFT